MRRTLAITAAAFALSLAACGAQNDGAGVYGTAVDSVTATDTMRGENGVAGTGTAAGATVNAATAAENTLDSIAGAVNRATRRDDADVYGYTRYSGAAFESERAAKNGAAVQNGSAGVARGAVDYADDAAVRRAAISGDRYARMLENGRVHDRDGMLLDGENAHWRTF